MDAKHKNHYCVILAGGIGSRLWPYSTPQNPKQFHDIMESGYTMLQITYHRFLHILPPENIFISTWHGYKDIIKKQLPNISENQIVAEPIQLSTAPAVALSASYIAALNPDASLIVSPADQIITYTENFYSQIEQGFEFVDNELSFLALGVKATTPEIGYGYLQAGEETVEGFSKVKSFTEKPSKEFAEFFVASGEFYWSTSLFMTHVQNLLEVLKNDYSDILEVMKMHQDGKIQSEIVKYIDNHYPRSRFRSIDMLILEDSRNVYIKPCSFGWKDLGNWLDFYQVSQHDGLQNVGVNIHTALYNCHDNIMITTPGKIVMMQDMEGYLVVDRGDMLLICKKDDTSQLRRIMTDADIKWRIK